MLRKLAAYRRQNQLDLALQELGRIERTREDRTASF
jgi:TnpA family transposase